MKMFRRLPPETFMLVLCALEIFRKLALSRDSTILNALSNVFASLRVRDIRQLILYHWY